MCRDSTFQRARLAGLLAGLLVFTMLAPGAIASPASPLQSSGTAPGGQKGPDSDARSCEALRGLAGGLVSVSTVEWVAAGEEGAAHCRVTGRILPEIGFEVRLPDDWNGRFLMYGNGGFAGRIQTDFQPALGRGFAVAATDTGHDADREPDASFGVDRQKVIDFAYRAVHVTAQSAKEIVTDYFGNAPEFSYFVGCSTGGRQGLMEAQRFPGDFDGILVGAPVLDETGIHVWEVWLNRAMDRHPVRIDQLELLAARVEAVCDGADGLEDGLISDPEACAFDPATDLPLCDGKVSRSDCFTEGQIETLEQIYGDVTSDGESIFPGLPVGVEQPGLTQLNPQGEGFLASGWIPWIVNQNRRPASLYFADSFLRYMAFDPPDPDYDWREFDFDRDLERMSWIRSVLDATDPDLGEFHDRGGRILMYFGWADGGLNPRMATAYYDDVLATTGASTPEFFRLFMIPGMFHCGGGVGDPGFEAFAPLRAWVEEGTAPERIEVSYHEDGEVVRTRPACPYPQAARYLGSGGIDQAASFECVEPQ